jgi:hypothetical protein
MLVSAVVTTRMSRPTMNDATEVRASTHRWASVDETFLPLVRT